MIIAVQRVRVHLYRAGDHRLCLSKDINMYCSGDTEWDPDDRQEKNLCQCRKDMVFDIGYVCIVCDVLHCIFDVWCSKLLNSVTWSVEST